MRKFLSLLAGLIAYISVYAQPAITPVGPTGFCSPGSMVLTITGAVPGSAIIWEKSIDGGATWNVVPGQTAITLSVSAFGLYRAQVTPPGGPTNTTNEVDVAEYPKPVPSFSINNDNACSGTNIQFTNATTGGTPPYTYAWDFGDATTSAVQNPSHAYISLGCGTGTFNAKLTVTDAHGCSNVTPLQQVHVKQAPDMRLLDTDVFTPFSNCDKNPTQGNSQFILVVNSSSSGCIISSSLDWGDGTPVVNNPTFPLSHTYLLLGAYNLVFTGVGSNGCTYAKTYIVANQSNPAGGLGTLGSTTGLCAPATIPFIISNWQNNSPGTKYILNFGDGTSITLSHPLTTDTVYHTYTTTSCPNATTFTATLRAVNACDSTPYTAGNIQIRIKPVAAFTAPANACANQSVCFTNTSVAGYNGSTCSSVTIWNWNFGDNTPADTARVPCHTYTAPGIYTITLSANNPCGTTTFTKQICITGPAVSDFLLDKTEGCAPQTVTATNTSSAGNACAQATYLWVVTYTASNCGTTGASNYFTNGTNATSANPSFLFTNSGTYTIRLAVTNACGTVNSTKVVVIKKPPTVTLPLIPPACSSVTITPTATVTNCGTGSLTYVWTFTGGSIATFSGANPPPVTFSTPGANSITVAITNECGTTTATQPFTINSPPALTVPANATYCGGQSAGPFTFTSTTPGTTFTWANNNTAIGLGSGSNTNTIASFIAQNNTGALITATITVTATKGGCTNTQSFTITVNPRPGKPSAVRPVIYCLNETASALSASPAAGNTLTWYNSYPLVSGSPTAPTPSTAAAGTTTYYVTQTNSFTCESDTSKITVTITPAITNNTISASQTLCSGGNAQPLTAATIGGGSGSYSYQWQSSTDGGVTWTNIPGATLATYNPGSVNADTKYRRTVTSSTCTDTSNVVTISVQGSLTNADIAGPQTICTGSTPAILLGQLPAGGNGSFTYQWESAANNITWVAIGGATAQDYSPPALMATTYYRRKVVSGQCSVTSSTVQITVNPKPVLAAVTDKYYCHNSPSGTIAFTATPAGSTYTWMNDNPQIGLAVSGTGNIASFTATNNSSPKVPVNGLIKVVPTYTVNSVGCPGDTVAFKIFVLPAIAIAPISDEVKCTGQTVPALTPVADTATFPGSSLQYSWTVSGSGITLLNGSGPQIPSYTTINNGTTDLVATITITPKYTYNGNTCDGTPTAYTVTVKPATATANAGADAVLCNASTTTLAAAFVNGTTGLWSQVGTGAVIVSPTQNITQVNGLQPGVIYKFVWTQAGFASCPASADTVLIDNKPPLTNKIDTATLTICAGNTIAILGLPPSGGGGSYTYQWQQSTDGINYTNINGATLQNISITPTASIWLRRAVTAPPCSDYSDTAHIIVQPALANNTISADASICTGTAVSPITGSQPTGGNNQYTYAWEQSTNSGATWTATGAATVSYPPGVLTQTTWYRRTVETVLCSGAFGSVSNVVKIVVNPDAKALFVPADTVKCPPFDITPAVINLQPSAVNSQYLWYANGALIGSGPTFPGYSIVNENDSVIIKLKAVSFYGCKDDSLSKKFYTQAKPSPSFTLSDTVGCGPITVLATNTSTHLNQFAYFWDFGNGQTSTAIQPAAITFAPNPAYGDTTYLVKLKVFSPCDTLVSTKSIRVKSGPKALFTPTKTTGCSPMTVTFRNTSKGANNTYFWNFGDGATLSTTLSDPVQHTFISGVVDTFYVSLKAVNECGTDSIRYSIIVSPNTIRLNLAVNGTDHFGCAPHAVAFINNSQGGSVFRWNFGDGATTTTTRNVDTVYHTYLTPGTFITSLQAINNCSDTTTTETITVYPKPRAAFGVNQYSVCKGDTVRFTNLSDSATAYLWQFGDGTTSTLTNPLHIYTAAGNYTVKLISYRNNPSGNVCTDSATHGVQVVASQPGSFTASDSVSSCAPLTVTFVNGTKPSATALWNFGDGTTGSGDSVVHTFTTSGIYHVLLTVTVPGGCTYITTKTITVSGPSGTLQYPKGFNCPPNAVRLQAVATGAASYLWNFGDGTTQTTTQQIVFHAYDNPGYYMPSVTLQNGTGCNVPIPGLDTIKVDKIDAGFIYSKQQACGSTILSFTDTSHLFFGTAAVSWNFGDGTSGAGLTPLHTYAAGGTYTVQMIVAGNSGCSDTVMKQIVILVNSRPVVSISAVNTACTAVPVLFTGVVQSTDAITVTQWTASNGTTGNGPVFSPVFTLPGTYTVRLIAGTANGCYDTAYHTIAINPSPVVIATPSLALCRGATTQLNVTGAPAYQWLPLQGLSCYTCPAPVASPVITTPYVVEGKNSFGCTAYDTVVITVIQPLRMTTSPGDSICIGQSVTLLASGATTYNWSPPQGLSSTNTSNPTASPAVTTTYRVVGYDGFNCFTDTAFVTVSVGQYPSISLGPDLTLATGTLQPLTPVITNTFITGPIRNWLWTPATNLSCSNCAVPVAEIKKNITYTVVATTPYGCAASDTINIKVFCEDSQVFIPNAFTPDDDGLNDVLMVRSKGIVQVKFFRIFNRWGELVFDKSNFTPNDPLYGWDGKVRGKKQGPDVFVYTCEVICENGSSYTYKGNTSIIK